ncbi:MAG: hypothetical protein ACYC3I_09910 [Gemmataceae bacterium]
MRHSYRCHASPDAVGPDRERNGERCRVDSIDLLDTARCPCCRAPLVARMGREGPYFHCCCRKRSSFSRDPKGSALASRSPTARG